MTRDAMLAWVLMNNSGADLTNKEIFDKTMKLGGLEFIRTLFDNMRLKKVQQKIRHLRQGPIQKLCKHLGINYDNVTVANCKLAIGALCKQTPFKLGKALDFLSKP